MSDFILLGGLEMRSDLKTGHTQKNTERAGQAEKALYFMDCACLFSKRNTDITSNIAKTQH